MNCFVFLQNAGHTQARSLTTEIRVIRKLSQRLLLIGCLGALGPTRATIADEPHTQEYLLLQSMLEQMKSNSAPAAATAKKSTRGSTAQSATRSRATTPHVRPRSPSKQTPRSVTSQPASSVKQQANASRNVSPRQTAISPARNRVPAAVQGSLAMPTQVQTSRRGNDPAQQYETWRNSLKGGQRQGKLKK